MTVNIRIYGMGGQGIITLAKLIGEAAVEDGKSAIMNEEYSPYVTGGWSTADLIISDHEIDYPLIENLDYLVTLSQEGLEKNLESIKMSSKLITEKSLVKVPDLYKKQAFEIPGIELAKSLNNPKGTNMVIMGAIGGVTKSFSKESGRAAISKRFPSFSEININCFDRGFEEVTLPG